MANVNKSGRFVSGFFERLAWALRLSRSQAFRSAGLPGVTHSDISHDPPICRVKTLIDVAATCLRPGGGSAVNHSIYVNRNKHTRRTWREAPSDWLMTEAHNLSKSRQD